MIYVYVAGPFTAKPEEIMLELSSRACTQNNREAAARKVTDRNILRAKLLGVEVAKLGACPIIPHANTDHPDFERVQPYEFWIKATLGMLRMCDAIIMLPRWETSSGARGEHKAAAPNLPIFYDVESLKVWLEERKVPL